MKRITINLAKSVYQVAESVRSCQMIQRKRLNRETFKRYIQEQVEPFEWVWRPMSQRMLTFRHRAASSTATFAVHPASL